MNDDRISEVYKGEIWTEEAQARARRRINWMCSQVEGQTVLDIGTSQGIAAILLAREGFDVIGIDIQPDRIEYALADLKKESQQTQSRAQFRVAEGSDLPFEDESFDSILLGEVIEHLAVPQRVLAEARRVLKTEGRIVITTPFGVLHHHDHKQTFYPESLLRLISGYFGVVAAEVADRYFRVVAEKGADTDPKIVEALDRSAFQAVRVIQEELVDVRIKATRLARDVEKVAKARSELERRNEELTRQVRSKERVEEAWRAAKQDIQRLEQDMKRLQEEKVSIQDRYQSVTAELKRTAEQANLASRLSEELSRSRTLVRRYQREKARLQYRIEIRDWKLASIRQRRWWRLGAELGVVRKNPAKLLLLPVRIIKLLRSKPERIQRPSPPSQPTEGGKGNKTPGSVDTPTSSDTAAVVIPRRDIPAVGILGPDLATGLMYEMQIFHLDPARWKRQLSDLAPSLLIIDSAAMNEGDHEVEDLLDSAESQGIPSVLWDRDPERIAPSLKARFDVICGDGKRPADSYEGRLLQGRGSVQPRLHNPVAHRRRDKDAAEIEPGLGILDGVRFDDDHQLIEAACDYKVLKADGPVDDALAARIAATATPLLVPRGATSLGIEIDSEEEATALERSLLKSEVMRARLAHPLMRVAMREHSLALDINSVLGDVTLPRIDVMVPTMRPERLGTVFENLGRQTYPNLGLWLVAHGVDIDHSLAQEMADQADVELAAVIDVDESVVLGEVFNIGFAETEAKVVAKMDDDDFYGPEYLWDLYTALDFSGAEVAGKWAHYVYLEGIDSLVYRFKDFEHSFTEVVAISTLLMRREVLEEERFPAMPWGSGSVFLRALGAQGARVFAADRWNYLYIRGRNGARNTFPISDMKMLANSEVVCRGLNLAEVVV